VQASLVAQWMLVGFVHGVMNTDNMTISGETIDYGPCAFMEAYDPDTVFSSIDQWGRYAYDNQPVIAGWNLARFAESLLPLLADTVDEGVALAQKAFQVFRDQYDATWTDGMRAKLGLPADVDAATVAALSEDLLALLKDGRVDYTSFFRALSRDRLEVAGLDEWVTRWRALDPDVALMDRSNPIYIPRNHLVEEALTAATAGDLDPLRQLLIAVSAPFDERPGFERYASPAPEEFGSYRTFCGT
jgi:serine/tyrosine/threonine adenylyltransferase